jgi:hypothetical protein
MALISIPAFARYILEKNMKIPSGMASKKAHTCHLHLSSAFVYYCELAYNFEGAHLARKKSTTACTEKMVSTPYSLHKQM